MIFCFKVKLFSHYKSDFNLNLNCCISVVNTYIISLLLTFNCSSNIFSIAINENKLTTFVTNKTYAFENTFYFFNSFIFKSNNC